MQTKQNQLNPWASHLKNTDKYKDVTLVARLRIPLTKTNATLAALYLVLVEDRNVYYPSKAAMLVAKDALYGCTFGSEVVGYHDHMVLQIASKVIDVRFVEQADLYVQHYAWFLKMIEAPLVNEATLKEAKQVVKDRLLRDFDQPSKYAQIRAFESLGADVVLAINLDGDLKSLETITLEDVVDFVTYLKDEAQKMKYVVGYEPGHQLRSAYQLHDLTTTSQRLRIQPFTSAPLTPVEESKNINQTQLLKLYQTNIAIDHPLFMANRLAIIMLGQLPTSYLFTEIREKRSLCYSIFAQYIAFDGICVVKTGIEATNVEVVSALIDAQIKALEAGDVALLQQAKVMLINAIHNSEDNIASYVNLHYSGLLIGEPFDIETTIQNIKAVNLDDIKHAVQQWQPLLMYTLVGEAHEINNESL